MGNKILITVRLLKENVMVALALFMIPLMLTLAVVAIREYTKYRLQVDILQTEVEDLQQSVRTVRENQTQLSAKIDTYNEVLGSIIPEKEDYFSMIYALERLSQETGFLIVQYSIDPQQSTQEKIAITVDGIGDFNTFLAFLREYQYGGGRLITAEKIEVGEKSEGGTSISLNFYNKSLTALAERIKPVSQADITLVDAISEKTIVQLRTTTDKTTPVSYETKQNPF